MNMRQPPWYLDKKTQQAELYNNNKPQPICWYNSNLSPPGEVANNEIIMKLCLGLILDYSQYLEILQNPYQLRKYDRNLNLWYERKCKTVYFYENSSGLVKKCTTHTNLNCKTWYIRATVARVPYTKVLTLLNGTVQTMHH